MTVQELAAKYVACAQRRTRDNGEKFWVFEPEDEDLEDLIFKAHGDMLPDDWRYSFVVDALREIQDATDKWLDEPGFDYTQDLSNYQATVWLGSHGSRSSYVDDHIQDYGIDEKKFSVISAILNGYAAEKEEVFFSVLSSLRSLVDVDFDSKEGDDDNE